jgi:hypothetical protein
VLVNFENQQFVIRHHITFHSSAIGKIVGAMVDVIRSFFVSEYFLCGILLDQISVIGCFVEKNVLVLNVLLKML